MKILQLDIRYLRTDISAAIRDQDPPIDVVNLGQGASFSPL